MSAHVFTRTIQWTAVASALLAASPAFAENWTWRIDGLPASGACWDKADEISARFEAVTGIRPTDVRCTSITTESFDILLEYEAERRLTLLSTRGNSRASVGQFQTGEECLATLDRATSNFLSNTGVNPVLAECFKDPYVRTHPWGWRIESFGDTAKKPFVTSELILEDPASMTYRDLGVALRGALAERGIQTEFMSFRGNGPVERRVTMLYYANESFALNNVQHGRFRNEEECMQELPQATAALSSGQPLVTLCSSAGVGGTHYIMAFWMNEPGIRQLSAPERWTTFQDCKANLESVVDAWRSRGRSVLGAFCAKPQDPFSDGEEYRVELILAPSINQGNLR